MFPTTDEQERVLYKASSPDEESLVEFARYVGYELAERSPPFVSLSLAGPAAPSLSDALGTTKLPTPQTTKTGNGTLDTLTGNAIQSR